MAKIKVVDPLKDEKSPDEKVKEHAEALSAGKEEPQEALDETPGEETILLHFVEDGFTAQGRVWMRGQELEFVVGSPAYEETKDRDGNTWLDMVGDDKAQYARFGRVMFRPGEWPGLGYEDEEAAKAEALRGRKPPVVGNRP